MVRIWVTGANQKNPQPDNIYAGTGIKCVDIQTSVWISYEAAGAAVRLATGVLAQDEVTDRGRPLC